MTIELTESVEELLKARADRDGKPVEQIVSDIVTRGIRLETFREICAEPRALFSASGQSEDEFMEEYLREEHAARGVPYDNE